MSRPSQGQFTGAGPEGVVYGGPWAMRPSPRRVTPFALLQPDMHSAPPVSSQRSPGGTRIGRPPQWTVSRLRKLARMYVCTNLSIERIIKVLQNDVFRPRYSPQSLVPFVSLLILVRKNSAQKTIHKMLDNDPRYLRPESREEMNHRIQSLRDSSIRKTRRRGHGSPSRSQSAGVKTETLEVLTESLISKTLASLTNVSAERFLVIQPRLPTHFRIDSR